MKKKVFKPTGGSLSALKKMYNSLLKIAIVHPRFVRGGGSEANPLWIAQALKEDYDVTLISMGEIDLSLLNKAYGTKLSKDQIKLIEITIPRLLMNKFDALRNYPLVRYCKRNAGHFDLMISTYNVQDFGCKGIQFIADFSFNDKLRRRFDAELPGMKKIFYMKSPFRRLYLKLSEVLSGASRSGWMKNVTVVNSDWSGKILEEAYNIKSETIYPPVIGNFPDIPWEKKRNSFVCIGRIVPQKGIHKVIQILKKVRDAGEDVQLSILGRPDDLLYFNKIKKLIEQNHSWASLNGTLFGDEKDRFIACHRFGISGCKYEAFGITVAEMVKAGCIPWVPNKGGQVEIVSHEALKYDNPDDAVSKILNVLCDKTLQLQIRQHLSEQSRKFSADKFMKETKCLVKTFFEESEIPS